MNNLKRISNDWLAMGLLFLIVCMFFFDVLFLGRSFYAGDNLTINVPSKILFFRMLKQGQLPLWNPYAFSGSPFLADINLGLLSPFNIFYLFFAPLRALTYSIVSAVLFTGISMYLFCRKKQLSIYASTVSAAIFMFSGTLMTHILNTAILNTVVWLPLLLYTLESLIEEKKLKYATYSSIIIALSFFGGHIQYFLYITLFSVAYVLFSRTPVMSKLTFIIFVFLPALFLTAIQWVPFLQYAAYSTRPTQSLAYAGSVQPISFIQLLLPNFFGIARDGTSWGATADINGYLGIIPLILVVKAVFNKKSRTTWFFLGTAAVSLLLSLGKYSPVYLFAFYFVPFISRFRSPAGILLLYTFSLAFISGTVVNTFKSVKSVKKPLYFLILCVLLIAGLAFVYRTVPFGILTIMNKVNVIKKTAFVSRFLEYSLTRDKVIFSLWFTNSAILCLSLFSFFLLMVLKAKKIMSDGFFKFILFFLVLSDLFYFGSNTNIVTNDNLLQRPLPVVQFLKKDASPFRILTYPDPGAKPPFADPEYFHNEAVKALDLLQPNTNIFPGIESVSGYASVVRKDYASYISPNKTADPTAIPLPLPGSTTINELNVKYVITGGNKINAIAATVGYKKVFSYYDPGIKRTFTVFENSLVFPRAYLLDNKQIMTGSTVVTHMDMNSVQVETQSENNTLLVTSELVYPGWTVTVDGRLNEMSPYKNIFRAVNLSPGKHVVMFTFLPRIYVYAALFSAANWLYILGFLLIMRLGKKKIGEKLHVSET